MTEHRVTGLKFIPNRAGILAENLAEIVKNHTNRQHLAQQALTYAYPRNWDAILARQQEIYEELMASHELPTARLGANPARRPASARELTRDLAGWTPQMAPALSGVTTQPRQS